MSDLLIYTREGTIGVITIDNPPVNAFSYAVRDALGEALNRAAADPDVRAIVICGAGRTFVAGADIHEFEKIVTGRMPRTRAHPLLNGIEALPKPVVAAINGTAFGAGLELAMACHYRIAAASAQLGQPEV